MTRRELFHPPKELAHTPEQAAILALLDMVDELRREIAELKEQIDPVRQDNVRP